MSERDIVEQLEARATHHGGGVASLDRRTIAELTRLRARVAELEPFAILTDQTERLRLAARVAELEGTRFVEKYYELEKRVAELEGALRPFADFADKAEQFVNARAKDGGSPIMPSRDFRLGDFRRARAVLQSVAEPGRAEPAPEPRSPGECAPRDGLLCRRFYLGESACTSYGGKAKCIRGEPAPATEGNSHD